MKTMQSIIPSRYFCCTRSVKVLSGKFRIQLWALLGAACLFSALRGWSAGCLPPPAGLVSWWCAESNALDQVGTNNGLVVGGVAYNNGQVGAAFSFGVANGRISLGDPDSLKFTNSFTIEGWIYARGLPGPPWGQILMRSDTRPYLDPYYLAMSPSGGIRFHIEDLSGSLTHGTDLDIGPIPLQQWKHVAAVLDGSAGVMQLFIDGTLAGQLYTSMKPFRDLDPAYSPDVQIGNASGFNQVFNGLIDELAVYSRALSPAEVAAIYAAGSAGKCQPPLISVQPASQLAYWGSSVGFSVLARGEPPLSYQWSFAGSPIPAGTAPSLVLTNLQMTNAGIYQVVITNAYGSATSKPAVLTVNSPGVSIALHAGVAINGAVGSTYGIQYTSDLADTNSWRGIANVTLTVPNQIWYDAQPAVQPTRYYRVVPGPISIP